MSHSSGLLFFLILTFLGSFLVFDTKDSYSLWRLLSDILILMTFCFLSYLRPVVNFVFYPHSLSEILSPSVFSLCCLLTTAWAILSVGRAQNSLGWSLLQYSSDVSNCISNCVSNCISNCLQLVSQMKQVPTRISFAPPSLELNHTKSSVHLLDFLFLLGYLGITR